MKKLLSTINMFLASIFPSVSISNKKDTPIETTAVTASDEMNSMQNIVDEALDMAISARRVEEEMCYKSYGLSRPNSENRFVFTMNQDGTVDATAEKDPNGQKFTQTTKQDYENYRKLQEAGGMYGNIEMIRDQEKIYKFKEKDENEE